MRELLRRAWYLLRQRQIEADLAEEMDFHRSMLARRDENGDVGSARRDADAGNGLARRSAKREGGFGNTTIAREDSRAVWIAPSIDSVWQDAAYALRGFRRQPGFAAVVILVLGVVIGLHAALATVIAGLLLRPWPGIAEPDRVAALYLLDSRGQPRRGPSFSLAEVRAIAERAASFDGVAAMTPQGVRVGQGDAARPATATLVTGRFFELLGVEMAHGRGFARDEDLVGAPRPVAVLTYDFWQSAFGADPAIAGRTVSLNDVPFTIVGVTSREFGNAEPAFGRGLFVPTAALPLLRPSGPAAAAALYDPDYRIADAVARLAPGATRAAARAELDLIAHDFVAADGTRPSGSVVTGTAFLSAPGKSNGSAGPLAAAALVVAGLTLVWLIACANVGNLLLARAAARAQEIGIRLSLGASRFRIVRQLLTEGFVLALAAGGVGVAIAYELPWIILRAFGGREASFPFRVAPDGYVLGYAVLLAAASAIAFGLAPALHATRRDVAAALGQRDGLSGSGSRLLRVMLGFQVAVSVVLLVSAGLLVRGAQRQAGTFDPGFAVDGVSVVSFQMPSGAYDDARLRAFYGDVTAALASLPAGAIDAFAFASEEPSFVRRGTMGMVRLHGQSRDRATPILSVGVSPGYLDTLRIPVVAGRGFTAADAGRPVAIVNEAMARALWPNESPIGKTFIGGGGTPAAIEMGAPIVPNPQSTIEVVGVAKNAHTHDLFGVPPLFYEPFAAARPVPKLLVRTSGPAPAAEIARLVQRIDPRVRVQTASLASGLEQRMQELRIAPLLAGVLGAFALGLAAVGMFGVFAFAVRQRTREIGIRLALGAPPGAVVRLILAGHSRACVVGLAAGALGAVAASAVLRSRLHGLSPLDPVAYGGVAALLAVAGLAATVIPARRASRVDPAVALRQE